MPGEYREAAPRTLIVVAAPEMRTFYGQQAKVGLVLGLVGWPLLALTIGVAAALGMFGVEEPTWWMLGLGLLFMVFSCTGFALGIVGVFTFFHTRRLASTSPEQRVEIVGRRDAAKSAFERDTSTPAFSVRGAAIDQLLWIPIQHAHRGKSILMMGGMLDGRYRSIQLPLSSAELHRVAEELRVKHAVAVPERKIVMEDLRTEGSKLLIKALSALIGLAAAVAVALVLFKLIIWTALFGLIEGSRLLDPEHHGLVAFFTFAAVAAGFLVIRMVLRLRNR